MGNKFGGFSYIYNAVKHDIPFVESIESVIDVVDQFVLTECFSEDETWELCQELQAKYPKKVKLVRNDWVVDFREISTLANWTILNFDSDIKYVMELQSDEVIHEKDLEILRVLPDRLESEGKSAARWNYLHFVCNSSTTFPFCYSSLVRIVERRTPWRVIGDGVQFAYGGDQQIPEEMIINTDIEVFHYGKMKDPTKGQAKELSFQNLFRDLGFPDKRSVEMQEKLNGKCDYLYLFRDHVVNKTINKFEGTHPRVMQKRLEEFRSNGFEQFVSMMEDGLKIEFGDK